jgi:nucleoid DNA-binding protein
MFPDEISRRGLQKCAACGSTWFREEVFSELPPAWRRLKPLEPWMPNGITVLVCICGQPVPPVLQGVHGRTTARNIGRLQDSLKQTEEHSNVHALDTFRELAAVERAQLPALRRRVEELHSAVGRILGKKQLAAGRRNARGGNWQARRRKSANQGGKKGRDWLALEVQKQGITFRQARAAVTAVVDAMREGLRRDKWVDTPIGEFEVRSRAQLLERERFGRKQYLYERPTVIFSPDPGLFGDKKKGRKK